MSISRNKPPILTIEERIIAINVHARCILKFCQDDFPTIEKLAKDIDGRTSWNNRQYIGKVPIDAKTGKDARPKKCPVKGQVVNLHIEFIGNFAPLFESIVNLEGVVNVVRE